jgi:outer membrane protein TolC
MLFVVLMASAWPAAAQSERLTLEDAIERGLAASHRLAEAVARGEASAAAVAVERSAQRPRLAAEAGYTRTNHVDAFGLLTPDGQLRVIYPDVPDNYRTRLDLQWPIYTAGRFDALERAAAAEAGAATDDLAAARADLTLEITRAYWALVTAAAAERVVDESSARVTAQLQDVRNRFAVGLVPPNDVASVEAQDARQRMLAIQAHSARDVAEAELGRLIGAPQASLEPAAALTPPDLSPASAAELIDQARARRADRAALEKRVTAASERTAAAVGGNKPQVGIGGGLDYARPNPRIFPREASWRESWDASINVSWPLFDGGRTAAQTAQASAAERAARERLAEFDITLAAEIRQRLRQLESARAALAAAEQGVASATEARRVVGDRFTVGVATSTEVLDAQVALLQAQLDRTQAIADARLAEARLTRAIGE